MNSPKGFTLNILNHKNPVLKDQEFFYSQKLTQNVLKINAQGCNQHPFLTRLCLPPLFSALWTPISKGAGQPL